MAQQKKLAILVGGGPAPGINSVISAATIRSQLEGVEVVGVRDGFEWIMQAAHTRRLSTPPHLVCVLNRVQPFASAFTS